MATTSPFSTERLMSFSTCSVSSLKLFCTWFICNSFIVSPLLVIAHALLYSAHDEVHDRVERKVEYARHQERHEARLGV